MRIVGTRVDATEIVKFHLGCCDEIMVFVLVFQKLNSSLLEVCYWVNQGGLSRRCLPGMSHKLIYRRRWRSRRGWWRFFGQQHFDYRNIIPVPMQLLLQFLSNCFQWISIDTANYDFYVGTIFFQLKKLFQSWL